MATAPSTDNPFFLRRASRNERVPPIHGLATEVVAQILACLDSGSLLSAVLAHPLFYATFQAYQQHILKEILLRLIPLQLWPLAFASYEAESIDYSDWNLIRRLLDRLHVGQGQASSPSPGLPPLPLDHRMVAALERVHLMVGYFTADFAQQAIPRFNRIFGTTRPATSSPPEELRILRAFYRFQLYCNIFGRKAIDSARQADLTAPVGEEWAGQTLPRKSPGDMRRELEYFFWPWPPWANEQLACVFEYLETVISVFFDDVASHDIEWGWRQVDWVEPGVAIPHRRFLVSGLLSLERLRRPVRGELCLLTSQQLFNGLGLPYQLRQCDEFDIWKSLLDLADVCRTWRGNARTVTMANSLVESVAPITAVDAEEVPTHLGRYGIDELRGLEGQAAWKGIDDAATHPVELWRLSNIGSSPRAAVLDRTNLLLRDAGYVFWDSYVGETAEVLERVEACSWTFNGRMFPHELLNLGHVMRRSWRRRSNIWLEGGRGYWADGDEKRVTYKADL